MTTDVAAALLLLALAAALGSVGAVATGWAARWWSAGIASIGLVSLGRALAAPGIHPGIHPGIYPVVDAAATGIAAWCLWQGGIGFRRRAGARLASARTLAGLGVLVLGVLASALQPATAGLFAAGLLSATAMTFIEPHDGKLIRAVVVALLLGWAAALAASALLSADVPAMLPHWVALALLMLAVRDRLARLGRDAMIDELTGVANRRAFNAAMAGILADRRRRARDTEAVVVLLDIDRFKALNDRFGHAMGDRALIALATTLQRTVRANDLVARIGGDEFAVLLAAVDPGGLSPVLRRLDAAIAAIEGFADMPPTASMGATIVAGDDHDIAAVLARADQALIAEKRRRKAA